MEKGGEAACLALGSFISAFGTVDPECNLADRLSQACEYANLSVFNSFYGQAGTTLTAVAFGVNTRWAVHVGDSRLYGINKARSVELLTQDDTVSGAVNAHLGQANEDSLDNRLLQFIGIGETLEPHLVDIRDDLEHDLWLLTSDGAHSVGRKVLDGICAGSRSPIDLARKLVFVAEAMNTQDNATVVCIRSGHVESHDELHEGLTIQITTPDRNLDVWLPSSLLQRELSPITTESSPISKADRQLPKPAKIKSNGQNGRKRSGRKGKSTSKNNQLPLDVVFQVDGDND